MPAKLYGVIETTQVDPVSLLQEAQGNVYYSVRRNASGYLASCTFLPHVCSCLMYFLASCKFLPHACSCPMHVLASYM